MVLVRSGAGPLDQHIEIGDHTLVSDEPAPAGTDLGPTPHDLLLAALGSCTSMTLRMVAHRRGWPLDAVTVRLTGTRDGGVYRIDRRIELTGDLTEAQRADLVDLSTRCPVHRTLTGEVVVDTREGGA